MRRVALLAVVTGCGRISFDPARPPADAMIIAGGHDEDGDGIDDSADNCPHLPNVQVDTDGDSVGDDCDPDNGTTQHIALFRTFQPNEASPFVIESGTFTMDADSWHFNGSPTGVIHYDMPLLDADIWFGMDVTRTTMVPMQIEVAAYPAGTPGYYYGELYEDASSKVIAVTHYDGTSYSPVSQGPLANGIVTGPVTMHLAVGTTPAPYTGIAADVGGSSVTAQGPTPLYAGEPEFRLFVNKLLVDVRYAIVITTP